MPVPGAAVLFLGELTFMAGTVLLRCRSEFATEPFKLPREGLTQDCLHYSPITKLPGMTLAGLECVASVCPSRNSLSGAEDNHGHF
jgi:hypothetical protein